MKLRSAMLRVAGGSDPTSSPELRARAIGGVMIIVPAVISVALVIEPGESMRHSDLLSHLIGLTFMLAGAAVARWGHRLSIRTYEVLGVLGMAATNLAVWINRTGINLRPISATVLVFCFMFLPLRSALGMNLLFLVSSLAFTIAISDGARQGVAFWLAPAIGLSSAGIAVGVLRQLLQESLRQLDRETSTDALTGLGNRRLLLERAELALAASNGAGCTALCIVDLDGFREINDVLGHSSGDALLRLVGERITASLRSTDTVARLGGDEFAILLPDCGSGDAVRRVLSGVLATVRAGYELGGAPVHVDASVGVALHPEHGNCVESLLQHADAAMHDAKARHAETVFHDPGVQHASSARLTMIGDLRDAIEHDELFLHFQPKIRLDRRDVSGVEALARWTHRERGPVMPGDFIPVAERTALIHPLTRLVVRKALSQVNAWLADGIELPVSVNITAANIADPQFYADVRALIDASGVPPHLIEFELTESTLMNDQARALSILQSFRKMGVHVSLDDFGTGYSSLAYLRTLPVDRIKIDRSFVHGMEHEESNAMIVRSAVQLAQNLGLTVVAEGVETAGTLEVLSSLGCDEAQGYFVSRPLPVEELDAWLRTRLGAGTSAHPHHGAATAADAGMNAESGTGAAAAARAEADTDAGLDESPSSETPCELAAGLALA